MPCTCICLTSPLQNDCMFTDRLLKVTYIFEIKHFTLVTDFTNNKYKLRGFLQDIISRSEYFMLKITISQL